jgi:orotidine-5'-phosphate decarboxylase
MNFTQRLQTSIRQNDSLLCVGLDPDPERMPTKLKTDSDAIFKFCAEIIDSTKSAAAAFKLNFAFFEAAGAKGWMALENLLKQIPSTVITVADAKRGDIGNSSQMYARAILERLDFDAVTVNPFMGRDSVAPFLQWPEKGAFILCLTSNPGAQDFQYAPVGDRFLYHTVIDKVHDWNALQNCGLVVGATQPSQIRAIRAAATELPFLIPGVGAQGGDLEAAVTLGAGGHRDLALINVSRGIIYKSSGDDFAEAAGREAEMLRKQVNQIRKQEIQI